MTPRPTPDDADALKRQLDAANMREFVRQHVADQIADYGEDVGNGLAALRAECGALRAEQAVSRSDFAAMNERVRSLEREMGRINTVCPIHQSGAQPASGQGHSTSGFWAGLWSALLGILGIHK